MYLALLIRILNDLAARRIHFYEGAVGQTRLLAAIRINKLADLVGENDLARFIRVMLFHLSVGKLEYLQTVGVDNLGDVGLRVEIGLRARVVVHFFAVSVEELDECVPFVGAALFGGTIREYGDRGAVVEQFVHVFVLVVAGLFDFERTVTAAQHCGQVFVAGR